MSDAPPAEREASGSPLRGAEERMANVKKGSRGRVKIKPNFQLRYLAILGFHSNPGTLVFI